MPRRKHTDTFGAFIKSLPKRQQQARDSILKAQNEIEADPKRYAQSLLDIMRFLSDPETLMPYIEHDLAEYYTRVTVKDAAGNIQTAPNASDIDQSTQAVAAKFGEALAAKPGERVFLDGTAIGILADVCKERKIPGISCLGYPYFDATDDGRGFVYAAALRQMAIGADETRGTETTGTPTLR